MGSSQTAKGTQAREAYGQEKQSTVRPAPSFLLQLLSSMSSAHCWGLTSLLAHTSSYYITSHKQKQELQDDVRLPGQ